MPDCGEGFSGDSFDYKQILKELDLFSISTRTKDIWKPINRSPVHKAISIIINKGISEDFSRKIFKLIENSIGKKDMSSSNFKFTDKKLKEWGLSTDKIIAIRKILSLSEVNSKSLCSIDEGGIYFVRGFKIMEEEEDDIMWVEDFNVRRAISIFLFRDKNISEREARQLGSVWTGFRTQISHFLHRLRPEGAMKIIRGEDLEESDFVKNDI